MNTVVSAPTETPEAPRQRSRLATLRDSPTFERCLSPFAFLLIFCGYALWTGDTFVSIPGRMLDIHLSVPILVLGLSVLVTLACGEFDLSIGSMATLTTFFAVGLRVESGWSFWLVLAVCIAMGIVGGLVNGWLVVKVRVNAFIATLGTGGVMLGLSNVYGGGTTINPSPDGPQLPGWFSGQNSLGDFAAKAPSWLVWISLAAIGAWIAVALVRARPARFSQQTWYAIAAGICVAVVVVLFTFVDITEWVDQMSWLIAVLAILAAICWVLMNLTTFGRHLYATGSNADAARLAGVPVSRQTIKAFVLGGVLAAISGILLASSQGSAAQGAATGYLLPAFAAAFLSTVIFSRGQFRVWGTIFGGIFLVWVNQGLAGAGVPFTWSQVINGAVLILAVSMATVLRPRKN